jgi:hypothetical protein
LEVWKFGSLEVWKFGSLEVWKLPKLTEEVKFFMLTVFKIFKKGFRIADEFNYQFNTI